MAGTACVVIAAIATILAVAALVTGALTTRWYVIDLRGTETEIGLFRSCVAPSNGDPTTCNAHNYDAIVATLVSGSSDCATRRSASKLKSTFLTIQILVCTAGCLGFVAALVLLASTTRAVRQMDGAARWVALVILLLFTILTSAAGLGIFVYTLQSWLYCGKTYCEFFDNLVTCQNSFGYSAVLECIGFLLVFIAFITTLCGCCQSRGDDYNDSDEEERTKAEAAQTTTSSSTSNQKSSQSGKAQKYAADAPEPVEEDEEQTDGANNAGAEQKYQKDLPPGDWVFDEESGMYWSDAEALYLDRDTEQYYDPESGQWYDPEADKWYDYEG